MYARNYIIHFCPQAELLAELVESCCVRPGAESNEWGEEFSLELFGVLPVRGLAPALAADIADSLTARCYALVDDWCRAEVKTVRLTARLVIMIYAKTL